MARSRGLWAAALLFCLGSHVPLVAHAADILHVTPDGVYDRSWLPVNVTSRAELDALLEAETPEGPADHGRAGLLVALVGDGESEEDEHGVVHSRPTICGITFRPVIMRNAQRYHHSRFLKTVAVLRSNFEAGGKAEEFDAIGRDLAPALGYDDRFKTSAACAMVLVEPGAGLEGAQKMEKASQGLGWNRASRRKIVESLNSLRRASRIKVFNDGSEPLSVVWFDASDESRHKKSRSIERIDPGEDYIFHSWVGHTFVVERIHDHELLEESSDIKGFFVVSRAGEEFHLTDDMLQSCVGDIRGHDPHVRKLIEDPNTDPDALGGLMLQEFVYDLNMEKRLALSDVQVHYTTAFTEEGFLKSRAPEELFEEVQEWYRENHEKRKKVEQDGGPLYNQRTVPTFHTPLPKSLMNRIFVGLREHMEDWAGGMELEGTSCYGVRTYTNGSYLHLHVDTASTHVISGILNVDQDVDEPWPLEILDHEGHLHSVEMAPGDLVFYESAALLHGRPHALKGRSYANVFVHYKPTVGWHVDF